MPATEKLLLSALLLGVAVLISLPGLSGVIHEWLERVRKRRRTRRLMRRFPAVYSRMKLTPRA
jgi:hypothetical protein